MKTPTIVKRTKDYIIVKVYLPDECIAQMSSVKRKGKAKGIKRGIQSYKNQLKG